jgi:hypothetical protein
LVFTPEGIRKASAWELAPFAFLFKPKSEVVPSFGSFQPRISRVADLDKLLWAQNSGEIGFSLLQKKFYTTCSGVSHLFDLVFRIGSLL